MFTIFATPKAFEGIFDRIQRNAIRSWADLDPTPEILLFCDEAGTAEVAEEVGARHVPEVATDDRGIPLVGPLFEKAEDLAGHDILCYVNSDIILPGNFVEAVELLQGVDRDYLAVGHRWNAPIEEEIDFSDPGWEDALRRHVAAHEIKPSGAGMDYFLYPAGLWSEIPAFSIGRGYWDSWLTYRARALGCALVDASPVVQVFHQEHDYSHDPEIPDHHYWQAEEASRNFRLSGGRRHYFGIRDATHFLTEDGLEEATGWRRELRRMGTEFLLTLERLPATGPLLTLAEKGLWLRERVRSALAGGFSEVEIRDWERERSVLEVDESEE